jgi:NAD(P)-dependent dehydrogenase (short-subunit alcohol dehydrogenase family)
VLITGGGRGIGRACAQEFAQRGAAVVVCARTTSEIHKVATELGLTGAKALAVEMDVTQFSAVQKGFALARASLGPIDVLVNNAGSAESAPFEKTTADMWARLFTVNVSSAFYCSQQALGDMVSRGFGRVINVASIAGKVGFPYVTGYCAAKHAVLGLTRALALEVASKGVTVNAVCPGYVDTQLTRDSVTRIQEKTGRTEEQARLTLERASPQQRLFAPEEVAHIVAFLAEPGSRGINGQAINIDGGGVTA